MDSWKKAEKIYNEIEANIESKAKKDQEAEMYKDWDLERLKKTWRSTETIKKISEIIEKDFVPHFLPTYRIKSSLYPLPIIIAVVVAGILAYLTFVVAGVQVEESYFPEDEFGALGVVLNGVIFTVIAAISAFTIIF